MEDVVEGLLTQFHGLIQEVVGSYGFVPMPRQLPDAMALTRASRSRPGWLPVPGMYGGFRYYLVKRAGGAQVHVESWVRIIAGSEQAHVVTRSGWQRVDVEEEGDDGIRLLSPRDVGARTTAVLCWNVNNRVGRTKFRPEAAQAAMATDADVLVFNEFFPGSAHAGFAARLQEGGWRHQTLSSVSDGSVANRILIAARQAHSIVELPATTVDEHLLANALCVDFEDFRMLALRVPTYQGAQRQAAWDWIASVADSLLDQRPSLICGDLNTSLGAMDAQRVRQFHALVESERWHRVQPDGVGSYYGSNGVTHEIDHLIASEGCVIADANYVNRAGEFVLAGTPEALSDHAGLYCHVTNLDRVREAAIAKSKP